MHMGKKDLTEPRVRVKERGRGKDPPLFFALFFRLARQNCNLLFVSQTA